MYSFVTELWVLTPTRLIEGSTDNDHAVQKDLLYIFVLIWIYHVLVFTKFWKIFWFDLKNFFIGFGKRTFVLRRSLGVAESFFKRNQVQSCSDWEIAEPFWTNERRTPSQIFVWSKLDKSSIPESAAEVTPLQELMAGMMRSTRSPMNFKLRGMSLKQLWKEDHSQCLTKMNNNIATSVTVAHSKD